MLEDISLQSYTLQDIFGYKLYVAYLYVYMNIWKHILNY